jgi:hypothetical protein
MIAKVYSNIRIQEVFDFPENEKAPAFPQVLFQLFFK